MTRRFAPAQRPMLTISLIGLAIAGAAMLWRAIGQDATAPYDDPQSSGLLTLCSSDGKSVTGGDLSATPFASLVVGETGLPSELDATGAVATMFAYQPREGIAPNEFSGTAITAASPIVDPSRPGVQVPPGAWSLGDFVEAYPADWDGYVQLRLYLGTPAAGTLTDRSYDTADLRVDGDRWELVRGGDASCADAESTVVP